MPTAIQNAVANATPDEVPVYSRELPDYLTSRGLPSDWLAQALVTKIEGMPEAMAGNTLAQKQLAISQYNHGVAMRAFQTSTPVGTLVDPATATADSYANPTGA